MHLFSPNGSRQDAARVSTAEGTTSVALEGVVQLTAASETLDLLEDSDPTTDVLLDLDRVHSVTDLGRRMLLEGLRRIRLDGRGVALRDPRGTLPDPDLGDGTFPDVVE